MNDYEKVGTLLKKNPVGYTDEEVILVLRILPNIVDFLRYFGDSAGCVYFNMRKEEFQSYARERFLEYLPPAKPTKPSEGLSFVTF